MKLHNYFKAYSRISRLPKKIHIFLVAPTILRRGIPAIKSFIWFIRSNPKDKLVSQMDESLPPIELLWVVSRKDFDIIELSLISAVKNTRNPISRINLIVPDTDFAEIKKRNFKTEYEIVISRDSDVINHQMIEKIQQHFGNSFGWILQQFLKLNFVLKSESGGILVIDGDTVVTKETIWLNANSIQPLLLANSKHLPYFQTLNKLGYPLLKPRYSFVTHHMMFQPKFLRNAIVLFRCASIEELIDLVVYNITPKDFGAISLDYELYGTYMLNFNMDKVVLSRFCNLSINRNELEKLNSDFFGANELENDYKSISFHSWNTD